MRVEPHKWGESVLLAVSGGIDSVVMAELFWRCNGFVPVKMAVAHCNFHLRGEESDADAAFVKAWAESHRLECHMADFDTAGYASQKGISIEMAARELRYSWFDALCRENGYDGVCVAHNANDNVETLFLNLLRGTGLKGLCAMSEVSGNPYGDTRVFRPILNYSREEIERYAGEHGIAYRTDSTNLESEYKRNRLRNDVFPLLRRINPSFISTISRDIANFRQAEAVVESCTSSLVPDKDGRVEISAVKADPHWKYSLFTMLSGYGFQPPVIADIVRLLDSGDRILAGHRFESERYVLATATDYLRIEPAGARRSEPSVSLLDWDGSLSPKTARGTTLVDADRLPGVPVIRKWRQGDWLNPLGMKGKKKVSDLLTDLKYDVLRKENVYVLDGDGSHVLAVIGERVDASVSVSSSTVKVYRISME